MLYGLGLRGLRVYVGFRPIICGYYHIMAVSMSCSTFFSI